MTEPAAQFALSPHVRTLLRDEIERLDTVAAQMDELPDLQGEVIDSSARLRAVLIWETAAQKALRH